MSLNLPIFFYRVVQKIHRNLPETVLSFEKYPNLDMSEKGLKINPALELIKAVCKVTTTCIYLLMNSSSRWLSDLSRIPISENFRFYL